jgi:demethylmenaquinone methyltransferase / 2-methoxy-6-polyprenyl-1,4-benzoquinol methylase
VTAATTPAGRLPQGDTKRVAVEAMFDRIAPRYDRMNRVISLGQDARWRRRAVAALGLAPGARVLDLACGTGDLCRELSARGHRPVGVDRSAGMLRAAATDAPLVRGDAERLPFRDESLDGVVCGFALRNFVDLDTVFRVCARLLRPGGRFVALDAAVPHRVVLRLGNAVWFRGAVPILGRLLGRDADAYRYLPRSTAYLPDADVLRAQLTAAGFDGVRRSTMTGGSVQLLVGARA